MAYEEMKYRIYDDGYEEYLDENGDWHNPNGWARNTLSGILIWYIHGKIHREDGPAMFYEDTSGEYWLNDQKMTKGEWAKALNPVKEMTVAEISKALGHEVKVVK